MIRLANTTSFTQQYEKKLAVDIVDLSNVEIFSYHDYQIHSTIVPAAALVDDLYSINILSKIYLADNNFLIYMNNNEYIIVFNHETIYMQELSNEFIFNDIIKLSLITKNLLNLLSIGKQQTTYFIIDSQYKELHENILYRNIFKNNSHGSFKNLGSISELVKKIPELETRSKYNGKLILLLVLIMISLYFTFGGLSKIISNYYSANSNALIESQIKIVSKQIEKNMEFLNQIKKDNHKNRAMVISHD